MTIIGRKKEKDMFDECLHSTKPEFVVVYGRRRVGKTYLVREYFDNRFTFYATGVPNQKMSQQLKYFHQSLLRYGDENPKEPKTWLEAFSRLRMLLEHPDADYDPVSGKQIVFLDELPWMDTPRSDFKSALDYFWNSYGSAKDNLMLIVCGSATSWIIKHILSDTGGLYNRITRTMQLQPFNLRECEEFFEQNDISISRMQIMECYMIFGGIPYYLNCYNRRYSLAQNIDELVFHKSGQLHDEYDRLFSSLFRDSEKHVTVIEALSRSRQGMTRADLIEKTGLKDGGSAITTVLNELEQCGFIDRVEEYTEKKYGLTYQLTDPFVLFCNYVKDNTKVQTWSTFLSTGAYYAWRGLAFEQLCRMHTPQIKYALGVSGVESRTYSWKSSAHKPGAQIDLIIDRRDQVINLCEMKFTEAEYSIDAEEEKNLRNKREAFLTETKTKKSLHLTIVSANGLQVNSHSGIIQNVITADDLFRVI